jgi:hypothetical protein
MAVDLVCFAQGTGRGALMATHDLELNMSADVIFTMAAIAIAYLVGANRVLRDQANQKPEPLRIAVEVETSTPKKRKRKRLPAPRDRKQLPPGDE